MTVLSEHYYTNKPTSARDEKTWSYKLKGESFSFTTDRGVFSKGEVDFGSRFLIESFEMGDLPGDILDVGCGYGPIGLALGKTYQQGKVIMIDVNARACELAEKNAMRNKVDRVEVRFTEEGMASLQDDERFVAVVTNPPIRAGKETVHDIYERAYRHLVKGGELWVVIQKKQGAPSTKGKLEELFGVGNVETCGKKKGYFLFSAKKID